MAYAQRMLVNPKELFRGKALFFSFWTVYGEFAEAFRSNTQQEEVVNTYSVTATLQAKVEGSSPTVYRYELESKDSGHAIKAARKLVFFEGHSRKEGQLVYACRRTDRTITVTRRANAKAVSALASENARRKPTAAAKQASRPAGSTAKTTSPTKPAAKQSTKYPAGKPTTKGGGK